VVHASVPTWFAPELQIASEAGVTRSRLARDAKQLVSEKRPVTWALVAGDLVRSFDKRGLIDQTIDQTTLQACRIITI
jgi:hypothetical protein